MLITPDFTYRKNLHLIKALKLHLGIELCPGVHLFDHWNAHLFFDDTQYEQSPKFEEGYHPIGVCDSPEQLLVLYAPLLNSPERQFFVSLVQVRKSDQVSPGGWRWHKWGPYIGSQEPTCEYLADELRISEVFTFHIYEKRQPPLAD